jgi:hypothetical protein
MMNILKVMDELLKRPDRAVEQSPYRILIGALVCYGAYAAVSGLFQGGWSVAMAAMKVPMIILGSVALCVPSLYVFTALAGAEFTSEQFTRSVAGFCGIAGLVLLGLMPVIWLFSVSTISLPFVVWLHVFAWIAALVGARRFLLRFEAPPGVAAMWIVLLFVVSLQMTTYLRPVLWREPDEPLFRVEKKSFIAHLTDVSRWKPVGTP